MVAAFLGALRQEEKGLVKNPDAGEPSTNFMTIFMLFSKAIKSLLFLKKKKVNLSASSLSLMKCLPMLP